MKKDKVTDVILNKEYDGLSDEKVIARLRYGDEKVVSYLLEKHKPMVRYKAGAMFIAGADKEDLIQEGMIGLYKAIRDFDAEKESSFQTFANLCVARQMYSAISHANAKKNSLLNNALSLDAIVSDDGGTEVALSEVTYNSIESKTYNNPEAMIISKEEVLRMQKIIEDELSKFEKTVLGFHMAGTSYTEIAVILDKDKKSIDNTIQRIKNKLKKHLPT